MSEFYDLRVFEPNNDTPEDVYEEVRDLWANQCLGNDTEYFCFSLNDEWSDNREKYPKLCEYLEKHGVTDYCHVHWWW